MLTPNSSNFETLINYFNFAAWIFYGTTISTVLWLRYKRPEWKRPYKVRMQGNADKVCMGLGRLSLDRKNSKSSFIVFLFW